MRLLNRTTNIDFIGKRKIAFLLSALLIVISIASLTLRGLNFGLDFTGGALIEVAYSKAPDLQQVRDNLSTAGLDDAVVQTFGLDTEIVVRIPPRSEEESSADLSTLVLEALQRDYAGTIDMRRVEFVGPQVGDELTEQGILAVVYALIGIFLYVMMRFQWRFSVGAVAALVHDVIITMGVISLLAVIGYSLNDTIVLFDRIRENFPRLRNSKPIEVVNTSVNQTLSRTLMTSLTTLLVLLALFTFGGEIINAFAFTLIIGVLVGTYSSIYVASTTLLELGVSKFDLLQVEKEGAAVDDRP